MLKLCAGLRHLWCKMACYYPPSAFFGFRVLGFYGFVGALGVLALSKVVSTIHALSRVVLCVH